MFPQITEYLRFFSDKLSKRRTNKSCRWFEYGRSQALNYINQEKIMLSTLVTDRVRYYVLGREVVPYSGMFIVPKERGYTLAQAERILRSADFYEYVQSVGINANGRTYRISPEDVANYIFDENW